MAEMTTLRRSAKPQPNIYTVLAIVACLVLASTVVYLLLRSNKLFGTANPFSLSSHTGAGWVQPLA